MLSIATIGMAALAWSPGARAALAGTYRVCAAGCDFTTLTNTGGVFASINANGISSDVRIEIDGDLNAETGAVSLNPIAETPIGNFVITIVPTGAPRTVTGIGSGPRLIYILGADRVVIDGSLGGGGVDRSLTLAQSFSSGDINTIHIGRSSGAGSTDITIKNCIIRSGGIGSGYGVVLTGADNDNFTFQNNHVLSANIGLWMNDVAFGSDNSTVISGNTFGDDDPSQSLRALGLQVSSVNNATVSGNTIKNIRSQLPHPVGMSLRWMTSSIISQNTITGVQINTPNSGAFGMETIHLSQTTISDNTIDGIEGSIVGVGLQLAYFEDGSIATRNTIRNIAHHVGAIGYGSRGIDAITASGSTISNNAISNIKGIGGLNFPTIVGIYLRGATNSIGMYFNSVNLGSGVFAGHSSGALSAAMWIDASASVLDIRDNVFATKLVDTNASTAKTYAIYSEASPSAFTNIDHNDYYASGPQGVLGYFAGSVPTDRITIGDWRASTGKDLASIAADPLFTSATDLRPLVASPLVAAGVTIGSVPIDISGATRGSPPTIGAYEEVNRCAGVVCPASTACATHHCDQILGVCVVAFAGVTTACGDPDNSSCNAPDTCDGAGFCVDRKKPANTVCMLGDASGCNPDDICDGTTNGCAPVYAPALMACGDPDDAGCNEPDTCNATGACVNRVKPANTLCLPASGDCDVDDLCDGMNDSCPATYRASTQECRSSVASCDPAEYCTGKHAECPADTVNSSAPVGDSVRVSHDKSTQVTTILWSETDPGPFNVYRGSYIDSAPWAYDHGCYAQGLTDQSTTHTTTPVTGQLDYFLVSRDDMSCPESSLGPDGDGTERPNTDFCPNRGGD